MSVIFNLKEPLLTFLVFKKCSIYLDRISPFRIFLTSISSHFSSFQDGPINPAEICPLIPPQSGERWRSPDTDLTRIFLDVLLELMVSQVSKQCNRCENELTRFVFDA